MNTAITRVLFNQRTGNVEIMHRFYVHDAEHALSQFVGKQIYLEEDRDAQKTFAAYVQAHFSLGLGKPEPTDLINVGQEIEGKFIWVYQEFPIPEVVPSLWFRFDALQEYWPGQLNQINVEGLGKVRSIRFELQDEWQSLHF